MALIPCIERGKEISDKAITCPQCGVPVSKRKRPSTYQGKRNFKVPPSPSQVIEVEGFAIR